MFDYSALLSKDVIRSLQAKFHDFGVNLKQTFVAFDDNNDGMISTAEFRRGIAAMDMKLTDTEVEQLIRHFDQEEANAHIEFFQQQVHSMASFYYHFCVVQQPNTECVARRLAGRFLHAATSAIPFNST